MYIEALQSESFSGVYNATAPNPVRMSELCSSLGSQLGRPSWLPVPDFALQVVHISFPRFTEAVGPKTGAMYAVYTPCCEYGENEWCMT